MTRDVRVPSASAHPAHGGRFSLTRQAGESAARYDLEVLLASGHTVRGALSWSDEAAQVDLDPVPDISAAELAWVRASVIGFSRILAREPKRKLVRWRTPG